VSWQACLGRGADLLPLDVATHSGVLRGAIGPALEQCVERRAEVLAGAGYVVARRAAVQPAVVSQLAKGVENVELRRADRVESARGFLRFVVEERKGEVVGFGHFPEPLWRVAGMREAVVRTDPGKTEASRPVLARQFQKHRQDVDHIGAMAAHESNNRALLTADGRGRKVIATCDIRQRKVRDREVWTERCAGSQCHEMMFTAPAGEINSAGRLVIP